MPFVDVGSHQLEYERIEVARAPRPTLVFLHEGLGSVAMWRDFPGRLAHATNCNAVVYSRYGYGLSDPLTEPRTPRYMHDEALVALPALLDRLAIDRPILVGHSDGGSIALIHAGAGIRPLAAVVTLAAHVLVEDISIASIAAAKLAYETTDLRARLARYHADVDVGVLGLERRYGSPRSSATGTSRNTSRASRARCWRSRARTTSTGRWSRCGASAPACATSNCWRCRIAAIRRTRTSRRR